MKKLMCMLLMCLLIVNMTGSFVVHADEANVKVELDGEKDTNNLELLLKDESSKKYINSDDFSVEGDLILFKNSETGEYKSIDEQQVEGLNQKIYQAIEKTLILAKKYDGYVLVVYSDTMKSFTLSYYESSFKAKQINNHNIMLMYDTAPQNPYKDIGLSKDEVPLYDSYRGFDIKALWTQKDRIEHGFDVIKKNNYLSNSLKDVAQTMLNVVYDEAGPAMWNYLLNEYIKEYEEGNQRTNYSIKYINGIEVKNWNTEGFKINIHTN